MPAIPHAHPLDCSDHIPPSFDGTGSYTAYREQVLIWFSLTSLDPVRYGAALIGRLTDNPCALTLTLNVTSLCAPGGALLVLHKLDQTYAHDPRFYQLDISHAYLYG